MKANFLAPDIGYLPQAQAVLLGQYAARNTIGNTGLDILVSYLAKEMIGLGNFQRDTRKGIYQGLQ